MNIFPKSAAVNDIFCSWTVGMQHLNKTIYSAAVDLMYGRCFGIKFLLNFLLQKHILEQKSHDRLMLEELSTYTKPGDNSSVGAINIAGVPLNVMSYAVFSSHQSLCYFLAG